MTDPTTATRRLADAAATHYHGTPTTVGGAFAAVLGPEPIAGIDRVRPWGSAMSNADTAAAPGIETLDTWPTDDDPVEATVLSVVDGVLGDAASALANLEARLDELILRLAPALSDDTDDYDGQAMADPDTDPRSDLVKAIDGLGLHADRLATRVRLTTERLDL